MIDFNIDSGAPIKRGDIDLILQQIDILFDTEPGEVFGDDEFGSQYDDYLYQLNMSAENLKANIMSDITSINLFGFIPDVEVYLLQGTEQDIALIDIELKRGDEHYNKTYKITQYETI